MMRGLRVALAAMMLSGSSGCMTSMSLMSTNEADKEPLYYTIPMDIVTLPVVVVLSPLIVPAAIFCLPMLCTK